MQEPKLLPRPQQLRLAGGVCHLPEVVLLAAHSPAIRDRLRQFKERLQNALPKVEFKAVSASSRKIKQAFINLHQQPGISPKATGSPESHELIIDQSSIRLIFRELAGAMAGLATLCQLLRQYGQTLPCLKIRDWPDFARRGVLLDVSRGRVPKLETLKQLTTDLAGFKINEFQLYFEHTFAYRGHSKVWRDWGALTSSEIRKLDRHCQSLGIDLVPNQNSFGHLRYWLEHKPYKALAEVSEPYPNADGSFLRQPTTLAPNHPGTLSFLRELYDQLLPNFSSRYFNVGCDETWDLGRGLSKELCQRMGQDQVYLQFLKQIQREVKQRGRTMMFWGDIILNHPHLIHELPMEVVALNWGYEADHPFTQQAKQFAESKIPFYVCPGTSTWQTLIGRNDNAFVNLRAAAKAGKRLGAVGYLITDWGDGGHPQPLAVSYPAFLAGAAQAWSGRRYDPGLLAPVLDREVFSDASGTVATNVLRLGEAHQEFGHTEPNATPFGATLAALPSECRELFCRNGLKYYAHLSQASIRSAWQEVSRARKQLKKTKPATVHGKILLQELDLATRMAEESCRYLLWQKAIAAGRLSEAQRIKKEGLNHLKRLKQDFADYWPSRNKATPVHCAAFLDWRMQDYQQNRLHYLPKDSALS